MHDLVIRNGTVVDGTGGPRRSADVAIDGDVIVAVERSVGPGRREIDATDLLVTPGFVDIHTHYDAQASWDPWLTPSSWHGCTTVVAGNCGVGFAPVRADRHDWLIALMEGVEDIPGSAMSEGITWEWEHFGEFLGAIERRPHVIDHGFQIAHGPVRGYVMGDCGARNEPATADDLAAMASIVEDGLRAGALGVSTSRTSLHKSRDGEFVPGTFAEGDELFAFADAIRRVGHGVFQLAMEHPDVPSQFPMLREFARRSGQSVSFNLNQADHAPDVWQEDIRLLDQAAADGLPIVAQVAGRPIGVLECLEGTIHPFVLHRTWREVAALPRHEQIRALTSGPLRDRLLAETPPSATPIVNLLVQGWGRMYAVGVGNVNYEPDPAADSLASMSARTGVPAVALALDAMLAHDGHGMLYVPLFNYSSGDLSMLHELHQHPSTRMGLSDAGAHCGSICDGGMPTFMLTHWTRDRTRGPLLELERMVHRQTAQTASLFGLCDRGVLAPGMKADVNVIDYANLTFGNARMAYDFPANARRLVQGAKGYVATVCSGTVIVEHDSFTGAMPGRLIRGPQPGLRPGSRSGLQPGLR